MGWYSVRCVFRLDDQYKERVTLWSAPSFDRATDRAVAEAVDYAEEVGAEYLGLAQAFQLTGPPGDGAEVFSLLRHSPMSPPEYLDAFFDTGAEVQSRI